MSANCLFCKISTKEIPAKIVYEDQAILAFHDLHPQAPTHLLIIPKCHIATLNDLDAEKAAYIGKMSLAAKTLAKAENFNQDGYRLVMNCNNNGGQTVFHIHMHLLAGRQMTWPPG